MSKRLVRAAMVALCLMTCAGIASAQVFTGRIDITAKDGTGAVLPGVTIELTGPQATSSVTDSRGEAHFLNLPPGRYTVTGTLSGFTTYKNDNVPVGAGSVVPLSLTLAVGGVATSVEVKAETPVLEVKKTAISTNVTLDELQNIPTSRDPWVVLQTVPGIVVDRVNVGGAESGQQSNYTSKGARVQDNTWNMDGVAITDMAALGSSPTYYDFDMFQEMQVTTGGADVTTATPGAGLNFVLRSGTNRLRGSARYYFENDSMQADNAPVLANTSDPNQVHSYNRMKSYFDTGFEVGGPIVKDRLWGWGAYGQTEPKLKIFTLKTSTPTPEFVQTAKDETILKNTSLKFNGDINQATRASFTYFRGDKQKFGRSASATRPAETTWDQKGPTSLYKVEGNRTLGNSVFLTARYAHITGGFSLLPEGGDTTSAYRDGSGVWHNTYVFYKTDRPQDTVQAEGTAFKGIHELKFGFGWRKSSVSSDSGWPGGVWTKFTATGYPTMTATLVRDAVYQGDGVYWNGYIGDTISKDRFTYNVGLRWDRQAATIGSATAPANPLAPDVLPSISSTPADNVIVYNAVVPRLGVTYALGKDRKTLLRASYAQFADQLDSNAPFTLSLSTIPYYSYAYYRAVDANGDHVAQPNEFTQFLGTAGFNPANPTSTPNVVGNYKTPRTNELVFGADHELMPNFGISASYTYRRRSDLNWNHYRGVTGSDYVQTGTITGTSVPTGAFSVPVYSVIPANAPADFGTVFEARDGYHQSYKGLELVATKRMSNNWMARVAFSTGSNREYFDNIDAHADPTPTLPGTSEWTLGSPNVDGGITFVPSSGSGKSNIFITTPIYQFIVTGAYTMKWDVTLGVNYLVRQGSAAPYYYGSSNPETADETLAAGGRNVVVVPVEDHHLPAVNSFDFRASKGFNYKTFTANLDFDIFNLFNNATPLQRQFDVTAPNVDNVLEIMNPRILRIGVRFSFK